MLLLSKLNYYYYYNLNSGVYMYTETLPTPGKDSEEFRKDFIMQRK